MGEILQDLVSQIACVHFAQTERLSKQTFLSLSLYMYLDFYGTCIYFSATGTWLMARQS